MNNIIELVVGDWSLDGHEKSETYVYQSNLDSADVETAFQKGSEIVGFNLTKFCEEYEDANVSKEVSDKLEELGLKLASSKYHNDYRIEANEWAKAYLLIAKVGNPELSYQQVTGGNINIGGYGIFD